ncbi:MAG TPA: hypothetical protein VF017_07925 [Thermoanaerobaculia bacterium]|nr:hypothetical protein [Thermoanaerobaculia bacterium]
MSRSLSWCEPAALQQALLAAGLAARTEGLGWASPRAVSWWRAPAARPAAPPILHPEEAAVRFRPFETADPALRGRLEALFGWIVEQTGCRRLFIVDAEGLVVVDKNADPTLVAISSAFVTLMERIHDSLDTPTRTSIAIEVDSSHYLHLLQAETPLGRYTLGLVIPQPLRRELAEAFRKGLTLAMSAEDEA